MAECPQNTQNSNNEEKMTGSSDESLNVSDDQCPSEHNLNSAKNEAKRVAYLDDSPASAQREPAEALEPFCFVSVSLILPKQNPVSFCFGKVTFFILTVSVRLPFSY